MDSQKHHWFENLHDLVTVIEGIVYMSVESTRIIEGLPSQLTDGSHKQVSHLDGCGVQGKIESVKRETWTKIFSAGLEKKSAR